MVLAGQNKAAASATMEGYTVSTKRDAARTPSNPRTYVSEYGAFTQESSEQTGLV